MNPSESLPASPESPPIKAPGTRLMTAGLAVSIVSLVLSWIPILGFAGLAGIVLALVGWYRHPARPKGKVVVACVVGLLATVAAVACLLFFAALMLKVMAV